MSTYENYSAAAQHYDKTRVAVGGEILVGVLSSANRHGAGVRLLDAGCGTGIYAAVVLPHVRHIDAVDINPGMISTARAKLADEAAGGRVAFYRGSISDLPFKAASFDAVMFNQVLHHLEPGRNEDYAGHRAALEEACRVLQPGGQVIVNSSGHHQLRDGFWYTHLIPTALRALYRRCIPTQRLQAMLHDTGFEAPSRFVPLDGVLQGEAYFDAEGPLKPEWRMAESSWALAPEQEIADALSKIAALRRSGTLGAYFAEHDARRRHVGQTTFLVARKA